VKPAGIDSQRNQVEKDGGEDENGIGARVFFDYVFMHAFDHHTTLLNIYSSLI
jgi:hypothetical protein